MAIKSEDQLQRLCSILTPYLAQNQQFEHRNLDEEMVAFAMNRHKVGPLLHCVTKNLPDENVEADLRDRLKVGHRKNTVKYLQKKTVEQDIETCLAAADIPFNFVKGSRLANQIYAHPGDRECRDIDILVGRSDFNEALTALLRHGCSTYDTRSKKILRPGFFDETSYARLFKDVTLIDPRFSVIVELHLRLFHMEPSTFTSEIIASTDNSDGPSISNPRYLLYIILHGAMAQWAELRMVIDLVLLTGQAEPELANQCLRLAQSYGAVAPLLASLRLADTLFPGCLPQEWKDLSPASQAENDRIKVFVGQYRSRLRRNSGEERDPSQEPLSFWMLPHEMFPKHVSRVRAKMQHIAGSLIVRL